jgi:hypothetical protein
MPDKICGLLHCVLPPDRAGDRQACFVRWPAVRVGEFGGPCDDERTESAERTSFDLFEADARLVV